MEFIGGREIRVGDLITNEAAEGDLFLLVYQEPALILGEEEAYEYPFKIISLTTNRLHDAYTRLEGVRTDYELVAKGKDLVLHY